MGSALEFAGDVIEGSADDEDVGFEGVDLCDHNLVLHAAQGVSKSVVTERANASVWNSSTTL
jgi:hypothetical protein